MRVVCISDTHSKHRGLVLPDGDLLIHAGDFTMRGYQYEVTGFFDWFADQPFGRKVCIAGNHDWHMEKGVTQAELDSIRDRKIDYLHDSEVVIDGVKIWGSPYQPEFFDWAFNVQRGREIQKHWDLIPRDVDIVVTHGPVLGHHDTVVDYTDPSETVNVGCKNLKQTLDSIVPSVHVCGHIHCGYGSVIAGGLGPVGAGGRGSTSDGSTLYINASILNEAYAVENKPIVFDIDPITKDVQLIEIY